MERRTAFLLTERSPGLMECFLEIRGAQSWPDSSLAILSGD